MAAAHPADDAGRRTRVLVVEDELELAELVIGLLEREGYEVGRAADGPTAIDAAAATPPDLVVLDLTLPGQDGVEVCRRLRAFSDAYVLMLTTRDEEVDRMMGLEVGPDDCLSKPFSPRQLVARVRAMVGRRRTGAVAGTGETRVVGPLTVDPVSRRVVLAGHEVVLTRIEFDLLDSLVSKPAMVFSRRLLRDVVWGGDWYGDDHVVDVHVANLRRKLGDEGRFLVETVRGVGYRLGPIGQA